MDIAIPDATRVTLLGNCDKPRRENSMRQTLAIALMLTAGPAAAQTADDPWAAVPALPTACYKDGDTFDDDAYAATEDLNGRASRQVEINQAIEQQDGEVDPMEMQQRMMKLLSENPEKAQQYMEALQQGGQQVQEQTPEMAERSAQFDAELEELTAAYDAERQQAMGPIGQQLQAVNANLAQSCNEGLLARSAALRAEQNQAYESLCADWWKAGPFHDWFARYRQFKIEEAAHWASHAETTRMNLELMGKSADGYRPTEDLKAPIEYLRRAGATFSRREHAPVSVERGSCDIKHG